MVKGQDDGIWRRVLLVPYQTKFGTEEEVRAGFANYVKDMKLIERLDRERAGILTWMINGCVEWFRDGLNPPDAVLSASRDYKEEQDRVFQFVNECCDLQPTNFCYLTNGNHEGIYPAYQRWCKIGGIFPLNKMNFIVGLGRIVPSFRKENVLLTSEGKRRKVTKLSGLSCPEYYEL
jgi:putative DNA primase/helicase